MLNQYTDLERRLWAITDNMRSSFTGIEFQNYVFGLITYKFLSDKLEYYLKDVKHNDTEAIESYREELGYYIEPDLLFNNILNVAKDGNPIIEKLTEAFYQIMEGVPGSNNSHVTDLFEEVNLNSSKLGRTVADKNRFIFSIMSHLEYIDFNYGENQEELNNAFDFLFDKFLSYAGKNDAEVYTPKKISALIAKLVTIDKDKIKSVYDPTAGSSSLLLNVGKEANVNSYYGQELNPSNYNLSRMNMLIHNINYKNFNIVQGDSLSSPAHLDKRFEVIVSQPPFAFRWFAEDSFLLDPRFSIYGKLAPKSKANYAFVQHMIYHLDDEGTMAVVLPHGVLFRGAAERTIRKYLVNKNYLDAVIGLPAGVFYSTNIPTCILIFKKRRTTEDVLFIDASKCYERLNRRQNTLTDEHIQKIVETYANREEIEKFSYKASINEIKENEFNLNIPRYVDTFEEEDTIDLKVIYDKHEELSKELIEVDKNIEKCCKELGIENPVLKKIK
ncbi:MAG: type I restriction-modification system subunit M [archaeon]|nr:type I restriction-modification system subunit M [archaeon]